MTDYPGRLPPPAVPGLTGLTVLARGGYATVYRAVQESVGREVAVKVENRTLDNERDQHRFLREARAAGRMSGHPHVVDLFDVGVTAQGHPYMIMELCAGSYADRMRDYPLTAVEAREVGVKIADALADSHHLGVLHRDVKPANILLTRFGEPALADFGLAVLAETRDSAVTMEVLTPAYAAPEMFRHGAPSPAVDVYALCATLYTVMRGKPPRWREEVDPSLLTLMEMFAEPIPDLPGVPAALLNVLRAGMANDPGARPSAAQLRDWLTAVPLSPSPVSVGADSSYYPWPATTPPGPPPLEEASLDEPSFDGPSSFDGPTNSPSSFDGPTVPNSRRRRLLSRLWGGLGVLLLVAAAGGIWYFGASNSPPVPAAEAGSSPTPTSAAAGGTAGVAAGCVVARIVTSGRCPTTPECFDEVVVLHGVTRARVLACNEPHTWEAYAIGELPHGVSSVQDSAVNANKAVRSLCSSWTLFAASLKIDTLFWRLDVLPPTPRAFAEGDRTFRCLAGKGWNKLTGATFSTD